MVGGEPDALREVRRPGVYQVVPDVPGLRWRSGIGCSGEPDRAHGDGLRIHCGPLDPQAGWRGVVAAGWVPEGYMADADGAVAPEFAWAALDCPTAYAAGSEDGFPSILLGRQAVRIDRRPRPGDRCVIIAWQIGKEGRKLWSQGALLDAAGATLAVCRATWIEVGRDVLIGAGM